MCGRMCDCVSIVSFSQSKQRLISSSYDKRFLKSREKLLEISNSEVYVELKIFLKIQMVMKFRINKNL
jgi:hypothetical protein